MRHTPGPWKICDHGEDTIAITDELQDYGICVVGSAPIKQVRANAHLIAAAPEMLAALQKALPFLIDLAQASDDESNYRADTNDFRKKIEAVIAKARGQS